ncbi:hypothetical protein NSP_650 [Nodularia spumigena CCY9414]|nr:hypothetical protein NSP_650 [Nodularia spumigena CCY9414]
MRIHQSLLGPNQKDRAGSPLKFLHLWLINSSINLTKSEKCY